VKILCRTDRIHQSPTATTTTDTGDLINMRMSFKHILDDKRVFGYGLELVTLHSTTWRADGHTINTGQQSGFDVIGDEPTIQWRFWNTNIVIAFWMLVTLACQNAIEAVYPDLSIFHSWSQKGKGKGVDAMMMEPSRKLFLAKELMKRGMENVRRN